MKFSPAVGPVGERKPMPYAFQRILPPPSRLVAVKLPRPLGITFEMDDQGWGSLPLSFLPIPCCSVLGESSPQPQVSLRACGSGDVAVIPHAPLHDRPTATGTLALLSW